MGKVWLRFSGEPPGETKRIATARGLLEMASQLEAPSAPQPNQQAETGALQQGHAQACEGYLKLRRRNEVLKRWKKEWLKIVPGEQ